MEKLKDNLIFILLLFVILPIFFIGLIISNYNKEPDFQKFQGKGNF